MSYGRKVLVSDIPANLEVGLDTDCYFRCGDVNELKNRLKNRLSDSSVANYDMSKYNWDTIAGQFKDVLVNG